MGRAGQKSRGKPIEQPKNRADRERLASRASYFPAQKYRINSLI
jgi:hypothetical protein